MRSTDWTIEFNPNNYSWSETEYKLYFKYLWVTVFNILSGIPDANFLYKQVDIVTSLVKYINFSILSATFHGIFRFVFANFLYLSTLLDGYSDGEKCETKILSVDLLLISIWCTPPKFNFKVFSKFKVYILDFQRICSCSCTICIHFIFHNKKFTLKFFLFLSVYRSISGKLSKRKVVLGTWVQRPCISLAYFNPFNLPHVFVLYT